jgi:hypothetical protein
MDPCSALWFLTREQPFSASHALNKAVLEALKVLISMVWLVKVQKKYYIFCNGLVGKHN